MNLLSLLMIGAGFIVEVLGVLFCVVNSGDAGFNMPLFFVFLAIGTVLTVGGVGWHILSKRL